MKTAEKELLELIILAENEITEWRKFLSTLRKRLKELKK